MDGTCEAQKESPVYREIGMIEDRLTELDKASQLLSERLSSVLSEPQPPKGETTERPKSASPLEESLSDIRCRIESYVFLLQNVTNRLTV